MPASALAADDNLVNSVASQFAAHGGFVNTNHVCNLRIRMTCFLKRTPALAGGARVNLVSLFLGKLVVAHIVPMSFVIVLL